MGHIINPIRLRLGYSVFWQNNWPIYEKARYLYYFGLHRELDQYFKTLFHTLDITYYHDNVKEPFFGTIPFPNFIYSNLNLNILGFSSETLVVDVNVFDFFLDEYLSTFFSPLNTDKKVVSFIKNLKGFFKLDYYLKYLKVVKLITKKTFDAIIKKRRNSFLLIHQVFIDKISKFIEIYSELIKRSLFSYINDTNIIIEKDLLYEDELSHLTNMPFKDRVSLLEEYWKEKYSHLSEKSLLTFSDYFTSVFYAEVTSRNQQKLDLIKSTQAKRFVSKVEEAVIEKGKKGYLKNLLNHELNLRHLQYHNFTIDHQNLLLTGFNDRLTRKFTHMEMDNIEQAKEEENPTRIHKSTFKPNTSKEIDLKKEIKRSISNLKSIYKKNSFFSPKLNLKKNNYFLKIYEKILEPSLLDIKIKDLYSLNNDQLEIYLNFIISGIKQNESNYIEFNLLKNKLQFLKQLPYVKLSEKEEIIKEIKRKVDNYIQKQIRERYEKWLNYDLDPFYQKFMLLKNIKTLILNININIGNGRLHISATFLTSYVKRLFFKNNPLWYIQRALRRTLYKANYLDGYLIIFSGRFTRAQYATYKLQTKGFLSFGNISKLIDYDTIGFAGKFGYCGIKVFLQYKNTWNIFKDQLLNESLTNIKKVDTTFIENKKVNIASSSFNNNSKKIKRILNSYITTPQIPYYNHD